MKNAKQSLNQGLNTLESFLNTRSKRELILLFVFSFLMGFAVVFSCTFEYTKESLEAKYQRKIVLEKEILDLQSAFESDKIPNNTQILQESIQELEQKIAEQERQKEILQNQSNIYALMQIAKSKNLQDFTIEQENQSILLSAKGKYQDFFDFLENLELQSRLEVYYFNLYPNVLEQNLEFYLKFNTNQGQAILNSQRNFE